MNAATIHTELLRLLARRGELTADLEQTDLSIARHRGMFEAAIAGIKSAAPSSDDPSPAADSPPASATSRRRGRSPATPD